MSICNRCMHANVCGVEGAFDEALTYCNDFLGWTPVSKSLPKENETVMASTKDIVYPEARYTKENGWEWAADYWVEIDDNVKAWMSLPKCYDEQESEKI